MKIVDLELTKTLNRASDIGYPTEVTDTLKNHLVEVGYDPKYGARPLKRAIQKWIDDVVTDYIIDKSPKEGTKFVVDYNSEDDISFITTDKPAKKSRKKKEDLLEIDGIGDKGIQEIKKVLGEYGITLK